MRFKTQSPHTPQNCPPDFYHFKHAFILKNQGTIYISIVNLTDDTVLIRVKDDGDGISRKIDSNAATGLGLKLVRHLIAGQLGGKMDVRNDDGTEICLQFKRIKLSEKVRPNLIDC